MDSVYIFEIEDAGAGSWLAEVAVAAAKPAEASRRIRAAGLHKKQISNDGRPVRTVSVSDVPEIEESVTGMVHRRLEDSGWDAWTAIPEGGSLNWRSSGTVKVQTKGSGHR